MGKIKWEKLGLDYPLADVEPPSPELSERGAASSEVAVLPSTRRDEYGREQGRTEKGRAWTTSGALLEQQPLVALFLTIAIGYLIGEINIKGFSLGVGAVLFVALAVGWFAPSRRRRRWSARSASRCSSMPWASSTASSSSSA